MCRIRPWSQRKPRGSGSSGWCLRLVPALAGVAEDRLRDRVPVGPVDPVTGSLQRDQPRTRDLRGQRLTVREREHWISGSVDDERRRRDRGERLVYALVGPDGIVVLRGGEVARPLDVAADELADRLLSERTLCSREHSRIVDEILDHRFNLRPIHLCRRNEARERLRWRRELALTRQRASGADENQ